MRVSRLLTTGLVLAVVVGLASHNASAVTVNQTLTINATVAAEGALVMATTINFPSSNPDTVPSVAATENPVSVTVKARTGSLSVVTLTALAAGANLVSGSDTIPISNVTWTVTGAGYVAGTMNSVTAQSVFSGTGPGESAGTLSFFLANSWSYAVGSYSQTVTYTLTVP